MPRLMIGSNKLLLFKKNTIWKHNLHFFVWRFPVKVCNVVVFAFKMYVHRLPSFENVCFCSERKFTTIKKALLWVKCFKVQIYSEFKSFTPFDSSRSREWIESEIWKILIRLLVMMFVVQKDHFLCSSWCCGFCPSYDGMPFWKYNTHIFSVVVGY